MSTSDDPEHIEQTPLIVYLDQCHLNADPEALARFRQLVDARRVSAVVSLVHFVETLKIPKLERRSEVIDNLLHFSRGQALPFLHRIVELEGNSVVEGKRLQALDILTRDIFDSPSSNALEMLRMPPDDPAKKQDLAESLTRMKESFKLPLIGELLTSLGLDAGLLNAPRVVSQLALVLCPRGKASPRGERPYGHVLLLYRPPLPRRCLCRQGDEPPHWRCEGEGFSALRVVSFVFEAEQDV